MSPKNSVIVETFLSRKPEKSSIFVAALLTVMLMVACHIYWRNVFGIGKQLAPTRATVFEQHQYWRLLTGGMVHADLQHFLANAPGFALLTGLVYGYFGLATCLLLVFGGGITVHTLSLLTYPQDTVLTGASGVVYLLAAFWITMYVCIERRHSLPHRILRSTGFSLVILFPTALAPEVSYRAHAIGFGLGMVAALICFQLRKEYFRRFEVVEEEY